jgi:hypothetical protein
MYSSGLQIAFITTCIPKTANICWVLAISDGLIGCNVNLRYIITLLLLLLLLLFASNWLFNWFRALVAASMKMTAFWDTALCSLVEIHRGFKGACCLYHQGDYHHSDNHDAISQKVTIFGYSAFVKCVSKWAEMNYYYYYCVPSHVCVRVIPSSYGPHSCVSYIHLYTHISSTLLQCIAYFHN